MDYIIYHFSEISITQDKRGLHFPRSDFGPRHTGTRTWPYGKLFLFFSKKTFCNVFLLRNRKGVKIFKMQGPSPQTYVHNLIRQPNVSM